MNRKFERPNQEETREIERQIASSDDEAPMLTREAAKTAQRFRGPQKAPTKTQVTLRLDADLVETLRASGKGWQTRANDALREALGL